MLQGAVTNILETKGSMRKSHWSNRTLIEVTENRKENQMEILELKNTLTKI